MVHDPASVLCGKGGGLNLLPDLRSGTRPVLERRGNKLHPIKAAPFLSARKPGVRKDDEFPTARIAEDRVE